MSLIAAVYNSVLGLRKRTWASGMTVKKNEVVKSPADNEDYERITATGGGATDPADDITNYRARSYMRTSALRPGVILMGYPGGISSGSNCYGATRVVVGILPAGTRTQALNITGSGAIDYLAACKGASGTFRVEVVADGRPLVDETISITDYQFALYIGSPALGPETSYPVQIAARQHNGVIFMRSFAVYLTNVLNASGGGCGIAYNTRSLA